MQAHAAWVKQERIARAQAAQAGGLTPRQGSEAPRPDLQNPFEPAGLDEAPMPECHTVPLVLPVLLPPMYGGELEVEIQDDHKIVAALRDLVCKIVAVPWTARKPGWSDTSRERGLQNSDFAVSTLSPL